MKLIFKIVGSLIIGIGITLYILQEDQRFKQALHGKLKTLFSKMFECEVTYTIKRVNFFQGQLEAENVHVNDLDDSWSWHAKEFILDISLFSLITMGKVGLEIHINDIEVASSIVDGVPTIGDHLKKLVLEASDLPFILKNQTIRKGHLSFFDKQKIVEGFISFSSETIMTLQRLRSNLYITDADISIWQLPCVTNGSAHITIEKGNSSTGLQVQADGKITCEQFDTEEKDCYFSGYYDGKEGTIQLHNKYQTLTSDLHFLFSNKRCTISSRFPINVLNKLLFFVGPKFSGFCTSSLSIDFAKELELHGTLSIDNALYQSISLGTIKTTFDKNKDLWKGTINFNHDNGGTMEGAWEWRELLGRGQLDISNTSTLQSKITYWNIKPGDAHIKCVFDRNQATTGVYQFAATHNILDSRVQTKGNFFIDDVIKAQGFVGKNKYAVAMDLLPSLCLKNFVYNDFHGQHLFSVFSDVHEPKHLQAHINFQFIRGLLKDIYGLEVRGEGEFSINGKLDDAMLTGTIEMQNGHIQIPETYNFLHNIYASLDIDAHQKKIVANDVTMGLHKGTITSKRATMLWDDIHETIFVHIPLLFREVFLNLEKDMFAEFSGNVLLEKRLLQNLVCRGTISIDQGQCKKNIFSSVSQRDLAYRLINPLSSYYSGIMCNLFVKTKKPFNIQTSFLHTNANLELMIKESIENPLVTGKIQLSSGMLSFPYKPLYITNATIYFIPHQLTDAAIELVAQGKVKKYHVILRANGSLQRPHISLESTPPLTEEQIITLLLAGSEEGSVALVMPTIIMQNLENLIFGPEQPHSKLEGYFKNLLGPLKHIRIVPSFFDQTGRGGLRGAFEIDVSDRLHALIEKNFSLSEDTRYEVEYLLSDDVTIRGIKDQRYDVGGEVEMRWKF